MKEINLQPLETNYENPYGSKENTLQTFLEYFWVDREDKESFEQWKQYVRESNIQAQIVLDQLNLLIKNPPANLSQIIEKYGEVYLSPDDSDTQTSISDNNSKALAWLKIIWNKLAQIERDERNSPEGVLRSFLLKFWSSNTEHEAMRKWIDYKLKNSEEAKLVIEKLTLLLDRPQIDLPQILWKYGRISFSNESFEKKNEESIKWLKNVLAKFSN